MPALTLTALALLLVPPGLARTAVTGTRQRAARLAGGTLIPSARLPRPRIPAPATRPVPAPAPTDPDGPPLLGPQAQGDVIVLPWLDFMAPNVRDLHTQAAGPVGVRGVTVHPSHLLVPEGGAVFWSWWPQDGPTLGTLVVPDGVVARLAHDEHGDLRIGPGVYAVRRQRRAELRVSALVED